MAPALIVTDQVLNDLIVALRTSLDQVHASDLHASTAREHYEQVRHWLVDAESFQRQTDGDSHFVRLRAFPLSGVELRALQAAVERAILARTSFQVAVAEAEQRHRADLHAAPSAPYRRLLRSIRGLHLTSTGLAAILALSLVLNLAGLVLLHVLALPDAPPGLILGLNGAVTAVALGLWGWHHWHLIRHVREVHFRLPHLTHHGHAV